MRKLFSTVFLSSFASLTFLLVVLGVQHPVFAQDTNNRTWLAGDHHIHSRYSVGWDRSVDPPAPKKGGDAIYPTPMNALMGKYYGLSWMVTTDHGGPNHSKVNLEMAYPELVYSRKAVPEVVQFYGMELDTPGADHSSLIIPHTHDESTHLHSIESQYNKREPHPSDPSWDTESRMLEALKFMNQMDTKPLVIANHPSRSAMAFGEYGKDDPEELRDWNDTAPKIAVGMAGAPGHQAATLYPDSTLTQRPRGGYGNFPTMGGFDQMTAKVGGFWDSMLGEGRRWWITANSDSHIHWREGGSDFWPGEYSKTYVLAQRNHDDIMDGIRNGRVFVTLGDLVSEVYVRVEGGNETANIGGEITIARRKDVAITIRFKDPEGLNSWGQNPEVTRVDLIVGEVSGAVTDRTNDTNSSTKVIARFTASDWKINDGFKELTYTISKVKKDCYLRVRGTNSNDLEPKEDERGESPWDELWFYVNPVFINVD